MIKFVKPGTALVFALGLTACATTPPLPPGTLLLAGLSSDDIKIEWGIPDDISVANDDTETWTYSKTWVDHSGNAYDSIQTGASSGEYTDGDGNKHTTSTQTFEPSFVPLVEYEKYCNIRFVITTSGRVQSVVFDGDCDRYRSKASNQHRAAFMPAAAGAPSPVAAPAG